MARTPILSSLNCLGRIAAWAALMLAVFGRPTPVGAGTADGLDVAALDSFVAAQMRRHWIPGVALAVVQGEAVVYLQGMGVDAIGAPVTAETPVFIGSQSKSFTALAIAQLAEAGRLRFDDPVQRHLPWFTIADDSAGAAITIDHLLHHTSGLSEAGFSVLLPDEATPEAAARALAEARLTAPVGTKFQYFNYGYDVLAYLVEVVSGQSYAAYVAEHILTPLGMTRSTADPLNLQTLPRGFNRFFGFPVPVAQRIPAYEIGAGYIVSTVDDLARYARAMKDLAAGRGGALISAATAQEVFQPRLADYGLGWWIGQTAGTRHISHGGANETFRTYVDLYPQRDLAIVLVANIGHQTDHFVSGQQLFEGVQAIVLGRTPPPVEQGLSVTWIGWGMGLAVLGLIALHTRNFLALRAWREQARRLSPARRALAVAISFLIPTVILVIIAWQLSGFYGYRFNLLTNLVMLPVVMPDVALLSLVGTIPDYLQGLIKLALLLAPDRPGFTEAAPPGRDTALPAQQQSS